MRALSNINAADLHQHSRESGAMADGGEGGESVVDALVSSIVYTSAKFLSYLESENVRVDLPAALRSDQKICGKVLKLRNLGDPEVFSLQRMPSSDSSGGFTFIISVASDTGGAKKFKTDSALDNLDIFELAALSLAEHVPSEDNGQVVNVKTNGVDSVVVTKVSYLNFKAYLKSLQFRTLKNLEETMTTSESDSSTELVSSEECL